MCRVKILITKYFMNKIKTNLKVKSAFKLIQVSNRIFLTALQDEKVNNYSRFIFDYLLSLRKIDLLLDCNVLEFIDDQLSGNL